MRAELSSCIWTDCLHGKLARFRAGALSAKLTRAPYGHLYRAHSSHQCLLDKPAKAALLTLLDIIPRCRPVQVLWDPKPRLLHHPHRCLLHGRGLSYCDWDGIQQRSGSLDVVTWSRMVGEHWCSYTGASQAWFCHGRCQPSPQAVQLAHGSDIGHRSRNASRLI